MFSAMENCQSKKTMGRRKIELKKIEKKTNLQVTFSKRRLGLFKKASELSFLCGAEIAILVQSPADKIFAFGNLSVESVLNRFQTGVNLGHDSGSHIIVGQDSKVKYDEAVRRLEVEKKRESWWDVEGIESMELHELEEYVTALEGLRNNVFRRLEEIEMVKLDFFSDLLDFPLQFNDQDFDGGKSRIDGQSSSSGEIHEIFENFSYLNKV